MSPESKPLSSEQIGHLQSVILEGIQRPYPSFGETEFTGSYDWHSNVHAYWALLSMARVTKNADLDARISSLFTLERLERELKFLKDWPKFEKPYGRAWFLLLLWELNLRPIGKEARFRQIRWELTQELLEWLQSSTFPETGQEMIGTHHSWLMSLYLFDLAKSENKSLNRAIRSLIETRVSPLTKEIESRPMSHDDFIFLPPLNYLIDPTRRYEHPHLPLPTSNNYACHYPGAIQISLWAHAGQCARRDSRACEVVRQTTQKFYQETKLWKDDFDCISHWLSLGMP